MGKKVDDAQAQYSASYAKVEVAKTELHARKLSVHGAEKGLTEAEELFKEHTDALHHAIKWEQDNPEPEPGPTPEPVVEPVTVAELEPAHA